MERTYSRQIIAVVMTVLLVTTSVGMTPALAAEDEGGPFGLLSDVDGSVGVTEGFDLFGVGMDRLEAEILSRIGLVDEPSASETADTIQQRANNNRTSTIAWLNAYMAENHTLSNYDVTAIRIDGEDQNATIWVNATVNDTGNVTEAQIQQSRPDNRTVDYTIYTDGLGGEWIAEDVAWLHENYVSEDKGPDAFMRNRMKARYLGHVSYETGPPENATS